jgi:hypothetical protein
MKIPADSIDRSSLLGLPPSLEALAPQSAPEPGLVTHDGLPITDGADAAVGDPADALLAVDAWDGAPAERRLFTGACPALAPQDPSAAADRVVDSVLAALS